MRMKRSALLQYLTPAIIVALVLGFSLVIPAAANDDQKQQCGYGYTKTDHESQQGENHENDQAEKGEACDLNDNDQDDNPGNGNANDNEGNGNQSDNQAGEASHSAKGDSGHGNGVDGSKKGGGGD